MSREIKDLSEGYPNTLFLNSLRKDNLRYKIPVREKTFNVAPWLKHNEPWDDCILYHHLSKEEYYKIVAFGLDRHHAKEEVPGAWDKTVQYGDELEYEGYQHVKGALAEYHYMLWSGEAMDTTIFNNHGDKGDFGKGKVEIKASTFCESKNITLKFNQKIEYPKTLENCCSVYVLFRIKDGFCHGKDYCISEIMGWVSSERFHKLKEFENRTGKDNWELYPNHLNKYLPETQDELIRLCEEDNTAIIKWINEEKLRSLLCPQI